MRKLFAGALIATVSLAVGVCGGAIGAAIILAKSVDEWAADETDTIEDLEKDEENEA